MNIRPFTDTLRRRFGPACFVHMFDTVAGGSGRHVRLGLLFSGIDGEADCRRTVTAAGDRWVQVDLDESGHSAWHFVVTRGGPIPAGRQEPRFLRASTLPTPFTTPAEMLDAIRHEVTRIDHPSPEYNRLDAA